jgi:ribosomal protein L31E
MAAKEKTKEPKLVLEREYTVPLRKGWLKVPEYKRANKATKTLKEFLARHMKVYDRDLRKIKLDILLNNELRFRGMRKPLSRVRVKAKKFEDGIVRVELVNLPDHLKFAKLREERKKSEVKKVIDEKKEEKKEPVEKKEEEKIDTKEKEEASKEEGMELAKEQARDQKHIAKMDDPSKTLNLGGKRSKRGR